MALLPPLDDAALSPDARAVFADIRATRSTDYVNDFWRVLANDPPTLARIWAAVKEVMAPGALDPLVKELRLRRGVGHQQLRVLHPLAHGRRAREGHDRGAVPRADGRRRAGERDQPARERLPDRRRRALPRAARRMRDDAARTCRRFPPSASTRCSRRSSPTRRGACRSTHGHTLYWEECGNPEGVPHRVPARRPGRRLPAAPPPLLRPGVLAHRARRPARRRALDADRRARRQHDLAPRRRPRAAALAPRHRALGAVRRLVGIDARARLRRVVSRALHRPRAARHLPRARPTRSTGS